MDFERRFGGINRLYGTQALSQLARAHVCVIGLGGVGSWAAEALARCGVGRLSLIDLDQVAESNTNRQLHALTGEYGRSKVAAMAARILAINPACQVQEIDDFITPENVATLLPACDAVLDAIDDNRAKAALIAHCCRQESSPRVPPADDATRRASRSLIWHAPNTTPWWRGCVPSYAKIMAFHAARNSISAWNVFFRQNPSASPNVTSPPVSRHQTHQRRPRRDSTAPVMARW